MNVNENGPCICMGRFSSCLTSQHGWVTALNAFTRPRPNVVDAPTTSTLRNKHDSILVRNAGDRGVAGQRARMSAATPATWGDAIDVPASPSQKSFSEPQA